MGLKRLYIPMPKYSTISVHGYHAFTVRWTIGTFLLYVSILHSCGLLLSSASASMRAPSLILPWTSHAGSSCLQYQYNGDSGHRCQVCCWAVFVSSLTVHLASAVGTRDVLLPYHELHFLICHQSALAKQLQKSNLNFFSRWRDRNNKNVLLPDPTRNYRQFEVCDVGRTYLYFILRSSSDAVFLQG